MIWYNIVEHDRLVHNIIREFTKGGLVKGGLAICVFPLRSCGTWGSVFFCKMKHVYLLNPPLLNPPLWTPEVARCFTVTFGPPRIAKPPPKERLGQGHTNSNSNSNSNSKHTNDCMNSMGKHNHNDITSNKQYPSLLANGHLRLVAKCLSGKDTGGPSKGGFLNNILFSWNKHYVYIHIPLISLHI